MKHCHRHFHSLHGKIFVRKNFRKNKLLRTFPTITFGGIKPLRKYSKFVKFTKAFSLKVILKSCNSALFCFQAGNKTSR